MLIRHRWTRLALRGGHIVDPGTARDEPGDLFIADGRIVEREPADVHDIDCTGLLVCPGLWDIHVHLREPGDERKETIESGTMAAAAGGFAYVACMPNTAPPIDSPELVRRIVERARRYDNCAVGPVACITRGRQGREIVDMRALLEAGAVAFSDDGSGVEDDGVMRRAFEQAAAHDAVLIQHCEYTAISAGGVMHAGSVATSLELPGLDPRSEEAMIERDIDLCRATGARYHVAHISTANAVDLVRSARAQGLPVTAEVTPHHLLLNHEACRDADPNTKMHPPLRTEDDVSACRQGLVDGTVDCIATDHAPHAAEEKSRGFRQAPPGIIGLETAVALSAKAVIQSELATWFQLVAWLSTGPARVLRRPAPSLHHQRDASVTLIDPSTSWDIDPAGMASRSFNTPFAGWPVQGRPVGTIRGQTGLVSAVRRW